MKQNSLSVFAVVCVVSLLSQQVVSTGIYIGSPHGLFHWGAKGVALGVAKSAATAVGVGAAKAGAAVKTFAAKAAVPVAIGAKTLLVAPVAIPIALGGKALLAAKLAVPMAVGAAVGAPVGALIGAKAGALKGAMVGKAMIAAKLGLAKKVAVKGAALAAAPLVLAAGAKAKVAAVGVGLLAKKALIVGSLATTAGASMKGISNRITEFPTKMMSGIKAPTLPTMPSLPMTLPSSGKGPTSIEYSLMINGPHTGFKSKKGTIIHERRRRDAKPEAKPEPARTNTQQLLQLVRSQNAQQCLQKVICELSANPNAHGPEGIRFGRSLISLESQTDPASAKQYRQAANQGAQLSDAKQCKNLFPTCAFQSQEIVRIGNQMIAG